MRAAVGPGSVIAREVEQSEGLVRQVWDSGARSHGELRGGDPLLTCAPVQESSDVEQLYVENRGRLRGLAASVTFDRAVADEITHDAFVALTARRDQVADPVAYLQRSVVNLAISHVRRRNRARQLPVRPIEHTTIPEVDDVWGVLGELNARQRAVIVLRFYEDLTYEQIAATLGIPIGSVKSSLHRALTNLEERL